MLTEVRKAHAPFALFLHRRGWTWDRIAHELGCSETTVQAMLRYALADERARPCHD
jgi:predicted transcriptional regulator